MIVFIWVDIVLTVISIMLGYFLMVYFESYKVVYGVLSAFLRRSNVVKLKFGTWSCV